MKLPDNMMSGLDAITVSTEVWVDPAQAGNYFVWNLGNTGTDGVGNGYLFATGNSTYRAAIASGNWTTEQGMTSGSALTRGAWKTLTYTLGDGVSTLYLDGRQVARNAGDHPASRRHRGRRHDRQLHRPVGVQRRQPAARQGPRLPALLPCALGLRGRRARGRTRPTCWVWSSTPSRSRP